MIILHNSYTMVSQVRFHMTNNVMSYYSKEFNGQNVVTTIHYNNTETKQYIYERQTMIGERQ